MENSGSLVGKVALITGGSRGIGAAIVRRLAQEGATIAFTYSSSPERAEGLQTAIETAGGRGLATFLSSKFALPNQNPQQKMRSQKAPSPQTHPALNVLAVQAGWFARGINARVKEFVHTTANASTPPGTGKCRTRSQLSCAVQGRRPK